MDHEQTDERPLCLLDLLKFGYTLHKMVEGYAENDLVAPLDQESSVTDIIESLRSLKSGLTQFQLRDSDVLAGETIEPLIFDLKIRRDSDEGTLGDDVEQLKDTLASLFNAVREEASHRHMYPVTPAKPFGDFGLPDFLEPTLPSEFDSHLREANRCSAVGFELSAVLCTLLATEVVTRYYYDQVTRTLPSEGETWVEWKCPECGHKATCPKCGYKGRCRSPSEEKTWGQLVSKLEGAKYQCPKQVTDKLKHIVDEYRNPAMHAKLEMESGIATTVWRICAPLAREMIEDLLTRGLSITPPTQDEIDAILMAADTIVGKADQNDLASILKGGDPSKRVLEKGWNKLPDYGALEDLTFDQIDGKVSWCIHHRWLRIKRDQDGIPLLCHSVQGEEQAKALWVEWLLGWFEDWRGAGQPGRVWPRLETINRDIKFMLLEAISERDRRDLSPVLRAWFPHEVKAVRKAVNRTLQSLGLQALPHPDRRSTQGVK